MRGQGWRCRTTLSATACVVLLGIAWLLALAPAAAHASVVEGSVTMVAEPGAYSGEDRVFDTPGSISLAGNAGHVEVRVASAGESPRFEFAPPAGKQLEDGTYLYAERYPFEAKSLPGISVGLNGGCNDEYGRFEIKDIGFDSHGNVDRLWLLYEQHCERPEAPALFGEIRVGEPPSTAPEIVEPAAIKWPQTAVGSSGADVPVTVKGGISGAVISSIALEGEDAGDFKIIGKRCTGAMLAPGERCELHLAVKPSAPGLRTAKLVVADASGPTTDVPLEVDTEPPPELPMTNDSVTMFSEPGDFIGQGEDRLFDAPGSLTLSGGKEYVHVSAEGTAGKFTLELAPAAGGELAVGEYIGAERLPFRAKSRPGIDVSGDGRGCNTEDGRFTIKDIGFGSSGEVDRLWALYEQRCSDKALFGEIRIGEPAGTAPEKVQPAAVQWPQTPVGTTSVTVPITVGGGPSGAEVTGVGIEGANAGDFSVVGDGCSGVMLAPDQRCEIEVAASPTAPRLRSAHLVLTDATGAKTDVALGTDTEWPPEPVIGDEVAIFSEPGEHIAGGTDTLFNAPESITLRGGGGHVEVQVEHSYRSFFFDLAAPSGEVLQDGEYAYAEHYPSERKFRPGIAVAGEYHNCSTAYGRFTIKDIGFDSSGDVNRLWALYEQHCESPGAPALFGEIRVGEPAATAPEIVQPSAIRWPQTAVGASSATVPVTVSVGSAGGEVTGDSLAGADPGDFSVVGDGCAGVTLAPYEHCQLEVAADPTAAGPRTAQLVVKDKSGAKSDVSLEVDSETAPESPPQMGSDSATMVSEPGDPSGGGLDRLLDLPGGLSLGGDTSHVQVLTEDPAGDFGFDLAAPSGKALRDGTYKGAERYPAETGGHPGFAVSGAAGACEPDSASFTIKDIGFDSSGAPDRLWALYEQHCGSPAAPALFGELRLGEPPTAAAETVQPAAIQWPETAVGARGAEVPVTVGAGASGAHITQVKLTGAGARHFSIAGDSCDGATLVPGERCEVRVVAKPSARGVHNAKLVIADSSRTKTKVPLSVRAS
jgi:hypothetical protein